MSFFGTNPQDQYKNIVQANMVGLDPAALQKQNDFVTALQSQMNGTGPSAASMMLRNNQQQQAASTNAQIAGSRGVNAGMALRQGLQTNAAANQATAGQAAVARQQEQLNATGMLGQQLNTMQGQNVGVQQANQQGGLAAAGINAQLATGAANNNAGIVGGVLQGLGGAASALPAMLAAKGGMIPAYADGGDVSIAPVGYDLHPQLDTTSGGQALQKGFAALGSGASKGASGMAKPSTPMTDAGFKMPEMGAQFQGQAPTLGAPMSFQSDAGKYLMGAAPGSKAPAIGMSAMTQPPMAPSLGVNTQFAKGGTVPAKVSPGERYLPPSEVKQVAEGRKSPMKAGEKIPGKPKVPGAVDDYRNDTVDKNLKSGGIVIPRHITQSANAPEKAAKFVRAVLAKQGLRK